MSDVTARCIAIVMRDVSSSGAQREKRTHRSQGHSLTYRPQGHGPTHRSQGQGPTLRSEGHNLTHRSQDSNAAHRFQGQNLKHRFQGHILTLMSKSQHLTYSISRSLIKVLLIYRRKCLFLSNRDLVPERFNVIILNLFETKKRNWWNVIVKCCLFET